MHEHAAQDGSSSESGGLHLDETGASRSSPPVPELDLAARTRMASLRDRMFETPAERERLGRFVVLDTLGAGAMGVVYAAYDPRLDRKIALKLVKPEATAAGARAEARLLREAMAMARLSHPNVVQIHEVGATDGRVYIAMELVRGRSLSTWLTADARSWREIVGVFTAAGQGLAAAHAVGIVHRDFKPENVLVGDDGRVRVTDFGLARGSGSAERTDPNDETGNSFPDPTDPLAAIAAGGSVATAAFAGTPRYMSPEQFLGEPTTPASDQFSFCVALHRALHGVHPFPGEDRASLTRSVLAGQRQAPARLRIPRRIDRALARGLARQPGDRFPSMQALLAALSARPRRLALVSIAAVPLAAAIALTLPSDPDPCADARGLLAGTWDDERRGEVQRAYASSGIPDADLLATSTTRMLDGYAETVADSYVRSCQARHIDGRSSEVHDLRVGCLRRHLAVVRGVVSNLATGAPAALREGPRAAAELDDLGACEDERALLGGAAPPPPGKRLAQRVIAARLAHARARGLAGDLVGSAASLEHDLLPAARDLGHAPTLVEVLHEIGRTSILERNFSRATQALEEGLDLAISASHDPLVVPLSSALIDASVQAQAAPGDAMALARRAHAWAQRVGAPASQRAALELAHSIAYQFAGQFGEAELASRHALDQLERELGSDHLNTAIARISHGNHLGLLGQHSQAIAEHRAALAAITRIIGGEHMLVADAQNALGISLGARNDRDADAEALVHLKRALELILDRLGPQAIELADAYLAIADIAYRRGELAEAERDVAAALAIYDAHPGHPDRAYALNFHGALLLQQNRLDEALAAQREALSLFRATQGETGDHTGTVHANIASVHMARGDLDAAIPELEAAIKAFERSQGPAGASLHEPLVTLAKLHLDQNAPCEALPLLERAATIESNPAIQALQADGNKRCPRPVDR